MTESKRCRLMEKGWKYTPAAETDISRLFRKVERQMKESQSVKPSNVKRLERKNGSK